MKNNTSTQALHKNILLQGTSQLGRLIIFLVLISLCIIIVINIMFKHTTMSLLNIMLFSAALAITAIPTALPLVITFCLTQGAMALQKHKVIIKRLSAIEDLGCIEVFCTDKTGTLTENSLTIKSVYSQDSYKTLLYAALSSDILMTDHKELQPGFDLAIQQQLTEKHQKELTHYTIVQTIPFSYELHRTITLSYDHKHYVLITKGSAEYVLKKCTFLTNEQLDNLNAWIQEHELAGSRVLALATKNIVASHKSFSDDIRNYDDHYETVSLIAFYDPLKTTAQTAIKKAHDLNVKIKILSGDSPYVCFGIAQQLGLENDINNIVLGSDFQNCSEEEKNALAHERTVFARVNPEQKYQIIDYLQRTYSVGYIGDGINDAPALKIANVGIAVNDASALARETAEIILLNKSLLNVIQAIEEGRKIVINTLKYIKITVASNLGNFYSLAISSLLINFLPMLPIQLLFLDLVTDFPLISISTDVVYKKELQRPLHYDLKDISFVTLIFGLVSSPFDFIIFALFKNDAATLQTCWFITSSLTQLALIFSLRTKGWFFKTQRPSNALLFFCLISTVTTIVLPFTTVGHHLFSFVSPTALDMVLIFAIVISYFFTTEMVKLFYYRNERK